MGYLGSKAASGIYQAIIALMPPHDVYIETHLGGGAIFDKKPKAMTSIGIDIDQDVINFRLGEQSNVSMNACIDGHGYDAVNIDKGDYPAGQLDISMAARVESCDHAAGQPDEFICTDAVNYLKNYRFSGLHDVLVYCDPPYLHSTRTSKARYKHEYSEQDHINLLSVLKSLPCNVILSGYYSELYNSMLPDWNLKKVQVMSRGGVRTECIWYNYDHSSAFWSTFAGEDYTDRQRIKRKAERWANNFKALPANEQTAILSKLLEA